MSVITLQFGQCGNQIGQALYSTINEDISKNPKSTYYTRSVHKWFNVTTKGKWEPRSVLIDTEIKVVDNISAPFSFKNIVAKSYGGSANNWAYGYMNRSKLLISEVLNSVRSEVEKCDFLNSILNIYSSSGGTGSGIGSYVIEKLRDEYPNKNIVSAVVLPYQNGEVATQSYNTLLNLSHSYSLNDSIIVFENERLHYLCKHALNVSEVSFSNINSIIAQQLASVYMPLDEIDSISLLNQLSVHPYKFLQIKSEPNFCQENLGYEGTRQWSALIQALSKHSRFDFLQQKQCNFNIKSRFVSSSLITRSSVFFDENSLKSLKDPNNYVNWLSAEHFFNAYHQNKSFLNYEKFVSLISNSNGVCLPVNSVIEDAWNLFTHGAYLHHYKKYDVDEDYFLNSFQTMENILDDYKSL